MPRIHLFVKNNYMAILWKLMNVYGVEKWTEYLLRFNSTSIHTKHSLSENLLGT